MSIAFGIFANFELHPRKVKYYVIDCETHLTQTKTRFAKFILGWSRVVSAISGIAEKEALIQLR